MTLGILLISAGHERAHYAFMLACAAAAMGRPVVLFATNEGCRALCQDWSTMQGASRDSTVQAQGVAGLDELRAAAAELGVRLMACDSGLRMAAIPPDSLLPGTEITGIPTFLSSVASAQLTTL